MSFEFSAVKTYCVQRGRIGDVAEFFVPSARHLWWLNLQ